MANKQGKRERKAGDKEQIRADAAKTARVDARKKADANKLEKKKAKFKGQDIRYIVRIANKDLDGTLPVARSLMSIKGIGDRMANVMAAAFEAKTGTAADTLLGKIREDQDLVLEGIVLNPKEHGVQDWMLNRRNDFTTGKSSHLVMNDLDFTLRTDLMRLGQIKSYRGLRLQWGLTVRGQKTKTSFRKRGKAVGVSKKENKK